MFGDTMITALKKNYDIDGLYCWMVVAVKNKPEGRQD
jgi:hypothetical protein